MRAEDWPSHTDPITTRAAVHELARLLADALSEAEAREDGIRTGPAPSDEASALASRLNFPEYGAQVSVHVAEPLPDLDAVQDRLDRHRRGSL